MMCVLCGIITEKKGLTTPPNVAIKEKKRPWSEKNGKKKWKLNIYYVTLSAHKVLKT